MAFIPAAKCVLQPLLSDPYSDCGLERPIVIDRFELTRSDLDFYYRTAQRGSIPPRERVAWAGAVATAGEESSEWPAFLSWFDACDVAGSRGMRLPTAREWLHVAVGRRELRYPWGKDQSSVANTFESAFFAPTRVGTFANGRSVPFGCYDLVGNVWEWVADAAPGYVDSSMDLDALGGAEDGSSFDRHGRVSVLGGSFNSKRRPTFETRRRDGIDLLFFHARRQDPATLDPEIGARMCADAGVYLEAKASAWGRGARVRERVMAVGRRWAEDSTARDGLLELFGELAQHGDVPEALRWLEAGVRGEAGAGPRS